MLDVKELMEFLYKTHYISTPDLTKCYWQVTFGKTAKDKMAFSMPNGHWHSPWLPFEVHGVATIFERLTDVVLSSHWEVAVACIDDIIMHA